MPSSVPSPSVGTCEVMRAILAEREDVYRDLGDVRGRQAGCSWLENYFSKDTNEDAAINTPRLIAAWGAWGGLPPLNHMRGK